ncbi:chemotaxis protein [Helicobacter sp. MIT 00-7814]|uniref:chemotaxis protein n=1 Tax=unclassified Helicobacter TaxID=2593540 RepID=UPI000E1E68AE|nr:MULTISPECIES: chemotaxis protein [unclassified Helicobacter]RDU56418.1 chemotaxis protein [Helicobacter sp. MIT 99-10781]RDU56501.1 chemotaxis protein [Helicobacter sp. MIT 00-7814]
MTQEELDALMNGGEDTLDSLDGAQGEEAQSSDPKDSKTQEEGEFGDLSNYRVEADKKWPPPPPTEDHKVVHQLDDVTKDSEAKGTQIFDQLEIMSSSSDEAAKKNKALKKILQSQEELFNKLCEAFPHIQSFTNALEEVKEAQKLSKEINSSCDDIADACMQAMDLMQYQDIHRQKIERVINVMRALAQYMNSLFEGKIDDSKRVSSAVYIAGDDKADVANDDEIEALIASFGNK